MATWGASRPAAAAPAVTRLVALRIASSEMPARTMTPSPASPAPGYFADLLVVRGDPVSNITATRSVALVIKSGQIVFAEDPAPPSPPGFCVF